MKHDGGRARPFGLEALYALQDADADRFLNLLNAWRRMTELLNELARSMCQPISTRSRCPAKSRPSCRSHRWPWPALVAKPLPAVEA